jgi:hypothetical protein
MDWCAADRPTDIDGVTDALSLWRLLVEGAVGRPLPPTVAVDANVQSSLFE